MLSDVYLTYQFIKRLVAPFSSWRAHKLGIIDEHGNILKKRRDLVTDEERSSFGTFDLVVLNLKKILAKVPGGSSFLGAALAATYLMREGNGAQVAETFADLLEDAPTNAVGGGAIAGAGIGPDGEPGKRFKRIKKILKRKSPDANFFTKPGR